MSSRNSSLGDSQPLVPDERDLRAALLRARQERQEKGLTFVPKLDRLTERYSQELPPPEALGLRLRDKKPPESVPEAAPEAAKQPPEQAGPAKAEPAKGDAAGAVKGEAAKTPPAAGPPPGAESAVLGSSGALPQGARVVKGWDFSAGRDLDSLMGAMLNTGFQATLLGKAVDEVNRMIAWRLSDEPVNEDEDAQYHESNVREQVRTKIFLGYTSNLISSGVREHVRYLVEHRMVDVVVTSAGGVEEDLIKCLGGTYSGEFGLRGAELRARGLNRIGNLLVPNANYCAFEEWITPILDGMLDAQEQDGVHWTPSKMIARLGKEIKNPSSICYWAERNGIPIFCPALTDGSIGDMLFFHNYRRPGLILDIVKDIRRMNDEALKASPRKTGMIILGGGMPKHHICNANLMRNGADFAVYLNTAQEYDGSDSGARPDEAVSWGKIRADAHPVKVCGDATILFPLLVSQTFAKTWQLRQPKPSPLAAVLRRPSLARAARSESPHERSDSLQERYESLRERTDSMRRTDSFNSLTG